MGSERNEGDESSKLGGRQSIQEICTGKDGETDLSEARKEGAKEEEKRNTRINWNTMVNNQTTKSQRI